MFQNNTDPKSEESDRLVPVFSETNYQDGPDFNERIAIASTSKQQQLHSNYSCNNLQEEIKSQNHLNPRHNHHKPRNGTTKSIHQQSNQSFNQLQEKQAINNLNPRRNWSQQQMIRSATSAQLHGPSALQPTIQTSQLAMSNPKSAYISESSNLSCNRQSTKHKNSSSRNSVACSQTREDCKPHNQPRQDERDRDRDKVVNMIREAFENGNDEFKESELENLSSLERNLPIELSFLLRQQAYCMARMNYLDRQIRELKEARQVAPSQVPAASVNQSLANRTPNTTTITNCAHAKNGNFILSDDSGGEYSRATISDDDELSSLLDQIAKSVRPERNPNQNVELSNSHKRANYSVITNQPQQYTIINPNQLHHQAVPVFVMSSPIAVAHSASSISSNVLPGVHFQPEPRYNQYYEDLYVQNMPSASTMHRHNGVRSHQFDSSISTIEQLVSQKEKRQIKSQLKTADNWLKMRSSGINNLNSEVFDSTSGGKRAGDLRDNIGNAPDRDLAASSPSATNDVENRNSVI